jgi:hypothetical protein
MGAHFFEVTVTMHYSEDKMLSKIKMLNESLWEHRINRCEVESWLSHFKESRREDCLSLLSRLPYFGNAELCELMNSLFRDLYKSPLMRNIRQHNKNTADHDFINREFLAVLDKTRFLSVGNPAAGFMTFLHFLARENNLASSHFIHPHAILQRDHSTRRASLRNPDIRRYIFIDDVCDASSDSPACLQDIVADIKAIDAAVFVAYYSLLATADGLNRMLTETAFDSAECAMKIDSSYTVMTSLQQPFPAGDISEGGRRSSEVCFGIWLLPAELMQELYSCAKDMV